MYTLVWLKLHFPGTLNFVFEYHCTVEVEWCCPSWYSKLFALWPFNEYNQRKKKWMSVIKYAVAKIFFFISVFSWNKSSVISYKNSKMRTPRHKYIYSSVFADENTLSGHERKIDYLEILIKMLYTGIGAFCITFFRTEYSQWR